MGDVDFTTLFINLSDTAYLTLAAAQEAGAPTINYGAFVVTIVDFVIVAFAIFMVIKMMNKAKQKEEVAPATEQPTTKACGECLGDIPLAAKRCMYCTSIVP